MMYAEQMATSIIERYPDPVDFPYVGWSYSQGFLMWGFIKLYEKTKKDVYLKYVSEFYDEMIDTRGNVSGFAADSLDVTLPGAGLAWLYDKTGQTKYKLALETIYKMFETYPRNADGEFWHGKALSHQVWVDGLFMGGLFLLKYGQYGDDQDKCYSEVIQQLINGSRNLQKGDTGLLYHGYCEDGSAEWSSIGGTSSDVWSEGLGWYALILAETLQTIPDSMSGMSAIKAQFAKLVTALAKSQDEVSGMWYDIVDKPGITDNWLDSSGTAMFISAIHDGHDFLTEQSVVPDIKRAWRSLLARAYLSADGLMNLMNACDGVPVQRNYEAYVHFPRTINAKEAIVAFILASLEMENK